MANIVSNCSVALTPAALKTIQNPGTGRIRVRDLTLPGLFIQITANGVRTWYCDYSHNGKRIHYRLGTSRTHSLDEARKACRAILGEVAKGIDPQSEKKARRVEIETAKAEERKAENRTLEAYLSKVYEPRRLALTKAGRATDLAIRSVFEPFMKRDLAALTVAEMEKFSAKRVKDGILPQTMNRDRTRLMALMNHAVMTEVLEVNPLAKWPKLKTVDDKRVRWLGQHDPEEISRFIEALRRQDPDIRMIVTVAMNTGLRRGEIFSLTWDAVDFRSKMITVKGATAKSGKSRHIPMNAVLMRKLRAWKRFQAGGAKVVSIKRDELVFPSSTGARRFDINKAWSHLCLDAKVEGLNFHDLRHDFASRLVMQGVPLYAVSNLLGHASLELTQRYAHLAPDHGRDAVEALVRGL